MSSEYTVACYYFPNYHADARNARRHGSGWTEWELVKRAIPRFSGHQQPKVPLWGYADEADPAVMAVKIAAAADHAIDSLIFDWYWYDDGPFLQRGLEDGFLGAANNHRLKFALMWANHDWVDIHPARFQQPPELLYPGKITPQTFEVMTDHIIANYFSHPSHWCIDGCPYFSVYELFRLVESFGGMEATRAALQRFRTKTQRAGFPDLHLNAVVWGVQILPNEKTVKDPAAMLTYLNFDSATSYVWAHHVPLQQFPVTPYSQVMNESVAYWPKASAAYGRPYHPNVSMGWDSSPRTVPDAPYENIGYPYMATLGGNTPALFEQALRHAREFLDRSNSSQKVITINSWNEWTEGSYLEPDTVYGMSYLEAIKSVFKQ